MHNTHLQLFARTTHLFDQCHTGNIGNVKDAQKSNALLVLEF